MSNLKFRYLYRDASNYKKWAEIVFSNSEGLSIKAAEEALKGSFLPDGLFIARQIRVPEVFLFKEQPLTVDDHCFHEFSSLQRTAESVTDRCGRSIAEFIAETRRAARGDWRAFDPLDAFPSTA
jgi:hypothetical protein